MHALVKRQILGCRQRQTRGGNSLYRCIIGQVDEHNRAVNGAGLPEALLEEVCLLEGDAHGGKNHREGLIGSPHLGLPCNLGSQLVVRQSGAGENRQLLSADQCIQAVNGRNAGLNKLLRIGPGRRVHGQSVDVHALLRQQLRSPVNGAAHTVKHTAQHIRGYAQLHGVPKETHLAGLQVNARGGIIELHQSIAAVDLQHLAAPLLSAGKGDLGHLIVGHVFHALHQHQRTRNLLYRSVFLRHISTPPSHEARCPAAS